MTSRFDRISPNDRILRSRFDQARTSIACAAPEAAGARERMKIRHTSFLLKMVCSHEMIEDVEVVSNLQCKFFDLKVRRDDPQPSIFVRAFRSFTNFLLSPTRDAEAAKRFFLKALHSTAASAPQGRPVEEQGAQPTAAAAPNPTSSAPRVINVDKNAAYPKAIADLKASGTLPEAVELKPGQILE